MKAKKVKSISDLLKHLRNDVDGRTEVTWFRGHADASWKLVPGYDRLQSPPKESYLVNKFRQNANLLINGDAPKSDFEWLFLMQHYGVPTRLLDWSESPLVALYFAVNPSSEEASQQDGMLWTLYPEVLNRNTNRQEDGYIPAFEESAYMDTYSTAKYDSGRDQGVLPIAAIATRNNPRIQAQTGVFTISHNSRMPIEDVGDRSQVKCYLIPADSKKDISSELSILGIDKFQMFPELQTIGELLKRGFQ